MVEDGLAVVVALNGLLNPIVGDQLYEFEAPVETPILTLEILQLIVPFDPASAVGGVLSTLTVTISVVLQPFTPVTVNV